MAYRRYRVRIPEGPPQTNVTRGDITGRGREQVEETTMKAQNPGSGTFAIDVYREGMANKADQVLSAGRSILCRSADHASGSELCIETIVRQAPNDRLTGSSLTEAASVSTAIHNLRAGNGHHKAQANHAGGNTCAQVIAAAIN